MKANNPNPNKANQHTPDPRQELFIANYLDPKKDTFANALQSAITAGYDEDYSRQLVARMPTWLLDKVQDSYLIDRAEKNLKEFVEMDISNTGIAKDGTTYDFDDTQKMRIKADVTKFALEKLKRDKYGADKPKEGNTFNGNVNILNIQGMSDDQLRARLRELEGAGTNKRGDGDTRLGE